MPDKSSSPLSSTHSELDILRTIAEQRFEAYEPEKENDHSQKILSSFIQNLPEDRAINICNDINNCENDERIQRLAGHLFQSILIPMRGRPKSPTPQESPCVGAYESLDEMVAELPESNSRVQQAKLRKSCLLRDNNKCVITGVYDVKEFAKLPEDQKVKDTITGRLEAAHIFPFVLGIYDDMELRAASIIWEGLYRCFPSIKTLAGLSVESINATFNALLLWGPFHAEFGAFRLAFEPTATVNTYKICTYSSFATVIKRDLPADDHVTLIAHHGEYELPAPSLLQAHAALAKILHATGMGEYIEEVLRDRDEIMALAEDGTTDVGRLLLAF